jgi:hypothetical protein
LLAICKSSRSCMFGKHIRTTPESSLESVLMRSFLSARENLNRVNAKWFCGGCLAKWVCGGCLFSDGQVMMKPHGGGRRVAVRRRPTASRT